jgi:transcriptional/translational regulatory protein YebC/TACO1
MGVELKKATLEHIANTQIELTDEQLELLRPMLEKLDEDEDVQAVYTNFS